MNTIAGDKRKAAVGRDKGFFTEAIIYENSQAMCFVYFISKSSFRKKGVVVPATIEYFDQDMALTKLLADCSDEQCEVSRIIDGCKRKIMSKKGRIMRLDLQKLANTKKIDFRSFNPKNIATLKWLISAAEINMTVLVYWPITK